MCGTIEKAKTIKYIGYYDILRDGKQVRGYSLAGAKKMDFICSVLNNIGFDVEILSPATKSVRGVGFSKSERLILKDGVSLTLPPSLKHYTPIGRKLKCTEPGMAFLRRPHCLEVMQKNRISAICHQSTFIRC